MPIERGDNTKPIIKPIKEELLTPEVENNPLLNGNYKKVDGILKSEWEKLMEMFGQSNS